MAIYRLLVWISNKRGRMQTGVYPLNNAWMWRCAKCDTAAEAPIPQRVEARAAYKAHRAGCRSGTPAAVPADPPQEPITTSPEPPTTEEPAEQQTPAEPQSPQEDVVATKRTPAVKAKVTKKKATKAKATKKKATKAKVTKKKAGAKRITTGAGGVFRFAFVKGKKGQTVARAVNESGEFSSRVAERLGQKRASKWGRIKAANKDAAIAALKAEKGQWFTKSKGESA
jgi:hypothetical protein